MDIRDWPMNRIMQLPDCAFGRRWPIRFSTDNADGAAAIQISKEALPEWCVLWELSIFSRGYTANIDGINPHFAIRLADYVPVSTDFPQLESLIPDGIEKSATVGDVIRGYLHLVNLKVPIHSMGRRVVVDRLVDVPGAWEWSIALVFSSMPTEVPDWLSSGRV